MSDLYPPGVPAVPDFAIEVALGRVPGFQEDFLVGIDPDMSLGVQTMLWDQGGFRTPIPAPSNVFVSSSDAGDTAGPTVVVVALDENFNRVLLGATLNGQNQVQAVNLTGGSNLVAWVQSAQIQTSTPDGDVYIALTSALTAGVPDDLDAIQGKIIQSNNVTRTGEFMIPAGMSGVNVAQRGGTDSPNKIMNIVTAIQPFGQPELHTVQYAVTPALAQYTFPVPVATANVFGQNIAVFPEKTILRILGTADSNNTVGFFGLDFMLVENRFIGN